MTLTEEEKSQAKQILGQVKQYTDAAKKQYPSFKIQAKKQIE